MSDLKDIDLPELGEGEIRDTLLESRAEEGADFAKGDVLAEVMTDKVSIEVEAPEAGLTLP